MRKDVALLRLIFDEANVDVPTETLQMVIYALDSHYLLRPFPPDTPEEYHARVKQAARDALKKVTGAS